MPFAGKKKVTCSAVASGGGVINNYPKLLRIVSDTDIGAAMDLSGVEDLNFFRDEDLTTAITAFDIAWQDLTGGAYSAEIYVDHSTSEFGTTDFWIAYGSGAAPGADPTGLYNNLDSPISDIFHFDETTPNTSIGSSKTAFAFGTNQNIVTSTADLPMGRKTHLYNGTSSRATNQAGSMIGGASRFAVSTVWHPNAAANQAIWYCGDDSNNWHLHRLGSAADAWALKRVTATTSVATTNVHTTGANVWWHSTYFMDEVIGGTNMKVQLNVDVANEGTAAASQTALSRTVSCLGQRFHQADFWFSGMLEELRVYDCDVSGVWPTTQWLAYERDEFDRLSSPQYLHTIGPELPIGDGVLFSPVHNPVVGYGPTFNIVVG